jgi:DNA-binding CsgD family transcriptional regulator
LKPADDFNLSPREKDVLGHLVKGNSYKMIADELQIGYDTVHSHIKKIYKKFSLFGFLTAVIQEG